MERGHHVRPAGAPGVTASRQLAPLVESARCPGGTTDRCNRAQVNSACLSSRMFCAVDADGELAFKVSNVSLERRRASSRLAPL